MSNITWAPWIYVATIMGFISMYYHEWGLAGIAAGLFCIGLVILVLTEKKKRIILEIVRKWEQVSQEVGQEAFDTYVNDQTGESLATSTGIQIGCALVGLAVRETLEELDMEPYLAFGRFTAKPKGSNTTVHTPFQVRPRGESAMYSGFLLNHVDGWMRFYDYSPEHMGDYDAERAAK